MTYILYYLAEIRKNIKEQQHIAGNGYDLQILIGKNGQELILPMTGYYNSEMYPLGIIDFGGPIQSYYWISTLENSTSLSVALTLELYSNSIEFIYLDRYYGGNIRPVRKVTKN